MKMGEFVPNPVDKQTDPEESAFQRVVGYFLGHEKPKDDPEPKPQKRPTSTAKKPSTKSKASR